MVLVAPPPSLLSILLIFICLSVPVLFRFCSGYVPVLYIYKILIYKGCSGCSGCSGLYLHSYIYKVLYIGKSYRTYRNIRNNRNISLLSMGYIFDYPELFRNIRNGKTGTEEKKVKKSPCW